MTSNNLNFILTNEYGFDTTYINGRFRAKNDASIKTSRRFFFFQDMMRNGFGIAHIFFSGRVLIKIIFRKIFKLQSKVF